MSQHMLSPFGPRGSEPLGVSQIGRTPQTQIRKMRIVHEDPAAKLNIDEKQWNDIVQENLRKYNDDRQKVQMQRLRKAQSIQQEQLRQVEEKNRKIQEERRREQEHFKNVGMNASNIYYVNQDKKDKERKDMRGGSKDLGEQLRIKIQDNLKDRQDRMREAAERRANELMEFQEIERKRAEDLIMKKKKLREMQQYDQLTRWNYRNRESELNNTIKDFGDKNIMSQVFEKKNNRSLEYDQKKEAAIGKIMQNFSMETRVDTFQKRLAAVSSEATHNPTQGPSNNELNLRKMQQKKKELEAKQFLDQQVIAKQALKAQQKLEQSQE